MTPRFARAVCWLALGFAVAVFIVRGPMRALVTGHMGNDLAPPYAATKAFLRGLHPYSRPVLQEILRHEGRELDSNNEPIVSTALYPPPTMLALSPLSMLSWPSARLVFLLANLILFAIHLQSLLRFAGFTVAENAGLLLMAGVFALAPYHTGIALGQLAIPSVTLLVIAVERIERIERARTTSGGIALAFAVLLKPQLAAPFLAYYLLRRQWRPALIATLVCGIASVASIAWLELHDVDWIGGWISNTRLELNGGAIDTRGPLAFHMIDARRVLTVLGIYPPEIPVLVLGAAAAVPMYLWGRTLSRQALLVLSAVVVWTLLVTYHRFYDAAILSLPLAWAAVELHSRRGGWAVLACCAVFFVPGQVMLERLSRVLAVPHWIRGIAASELSLSHQAWALCLLLVLLLVRMRRAAVQ